MERRHPMDMFVHELRDLVQSGQLTPTAIVEACLARISERNPSTNSFLHVAAESALAEAAEQTRQQAAGQPLPPLAGIPIGIKDLDDVAGMPTTYGHRLFGSPPAPAAHDSIQVSRLRVAGVIVVGKTNTPAEGFSGQTANLLGPPSRNPWCLSHSPGGSSGGSASAVAGGILPWAHGTDGGGSIRGPCAMVGAFGVKVTRGLIPTVWRPTEHGDMETWIRHVEDGPITRCVRDAAIYLDATVGYDGRDHVSHPFTSVKTNRYEAAVVSALHPHPHPQPTAAAGTPAALPRPPDRQLRLGLKLNPTRDTKLPLLDEAERLLLAAVDRLGAGALGAEGRGRWWRSWARACGDGAGGY